MVHGSQGSSSDSIAIVFGAASTRVAFQIGVLGVLIAGGIQPDAYVGSSAGALSAVSMAYCDIQATYALWLGLADRKLFRPSNILRGHSPVQYANLLEDAVDHVVNRIEGLCRHSNVCIVQTLLSRNGLDISAAWNPLQHQLRDLLWASNYVPGLAGLRPWYRYNGHRYIDGGVLARNPIETAKAAGFRRIISLTSKPLAGTQGQMYCRTGDTFSIGPDHPIESRSFQYEREVVRQHIAFGERVGRAILSPTLNWMEKAA